MHESSCGMWLSLMLCINVLIFYHIFPQLCVSPTLTLRHMLIKLKWINTMDSAWFNVASLSRCECFLIGNLRKIKQTPPQVIIWMINEYHPLLVSQSCNPHIYVRKTVIITCRNQPSHASAQHSVKECFYSGSEGTKQTLLLSDLQQLQATDEG